MVLPPIPILNASGKMDAIVPFPESGEGEGIGKDYIVI